MSTPTKNALVRSPLSASMDYNVRESPDTTPRKLDFGSSTPRRTADTTQQEYHPSPTNDMSLSNVMSEITLSDTLRPMRPMSMILTSEQSGISTPVTDFRSMKNSAVSHLRTLSETGDQFVVAVPKAKDVTGLHGRKRLTRMQAPEKSGWSATSWMDKQRKYLQAYEYLCHIGEAKEYVLDMDMGNAV